MKIYWLLIPVANCCSLTCPAQRVDTIKVKVHDQEMVLYSSGAGKTVIILETGGGGTHRSIRHII